MEHSKAFPMSRLTNAEFRCLYKELENRLKEVYVTEGKPFPEPREERIGYRGSKKKGHSIFSLMTGNEKVMAMAGKKKLSPKYLYNRLLEQESGGDVDLNKTYEKAYFLTCGCETKEEFFLRYPVIKKTCTYDVLYFSKHKHQQEIQKCFLQLQLFFDDTLEAAIWGFHKKLMERRLQGSVRLRGDCWRIITELKQWFLEITIHIGTTNKRTTSDLLDIPFLKGLLHGVTAYDYPISMECVLVKNDIPHFEEDSLKIKRYLNLLRNTFNVRLENTQEMNNVDHLQIEGVDLSKISYIASKTYRILTYNPIISKSRDEANDAGEEAAPTDGAVIAQSWFTVENDFTGWILLPPRSEKLHCLMSIANDQLVVQALDPNDHRLSTHTIIEIAPEKRPLIHGVFCTIRKSGSKPVGGLFVMAAEEIQPGEELRAEEFPKHKFEDSRPPENIRPLLRELYLVNGLELPEVWQ
ncbi:MAG TPA: hypothetical protein VNU72_01965 [Puia sp.]|nr:hypothetical protein [Puia sp.]